jgi:uncharacterized protein
MNQLELRDAPPRGRQTRAVRLEIRAVDDEGAIEGYGSVFGVEDDYGDVVAPGAFAASLKAHKAAGTMPAMLWQHRSDEPCGVWTGMEEDARGLKVMGRLVLESQRGREAHALLKAGALTGMSIGFMSKEWSYDRDTEIRTLTGIDLWEVSLVTFPANGAARVTDVKSTEAAIAGFSKLSDFEDHLREADAPMSKAAARAFVSRLAALVDERREAAQSTAKAQKAAERLLLNLTRKD